MREKLEPSVLEILLMGISSRGTGCVTLRPIHPLPSIHYTQPVPFQEAGCFFRHP